MSLWQFAFALYIILGLVVLALWERARRQNLKEQHTKQVDEGPSKLELLIIALLVVFCVVLWPLSLYLLRVNHLLSKNQTSEQNIEELRAVRHVHLLEPMSLDEIEQQHRIKDLLNAVPSLPFGHLHQSWQLFKQTIPDKAEIHRFQAAWPTYGKHNQVVKGYALVLNGTIGEYFVYSSYIDPAQSD